MPRYYFVLRCDDGFARDSEGIECEQPSAALFEAIQVATELRRHVEDRTRHWSLHVTTAHGGPLFHLRFAEIDSLVRKMQTNPTLFED